MEPAALRILMLGAGATGGYFGARLAAAGADIHFLVRPGRAAALARDGLCIRSPLGDLQLAPRLLQASELAQQPPFQLILLSCKAYDLDAALEAIAPAMGAQTRLLPLLNGLSHYPILAARFGEARILGGLCFINASLDPQGRVQHLDPAARLSFGPRGGRDDEGVSQRLAQWCASAGIDYRLSPRIEQDAWIKYSFLCALAAATCLLRASIGQIMAVDGGEACVRGLYGECVAVAAAAGEPVPDAARASALALLTRAGSPQTSSMYRDLQAGRLIEAGPIVGDMVARAAALGVPTPRLTLAWLHLQVYQSARTEA